VVIKTKTMIKRQSSQPNIYSHFRLFKSSKVYGSHKMSNNLSKMLNRNISIALRKGLEYQGTLKSFDIHWNLVLEDAKETVDGKLTSNYGTIILRGNGILHIHYKDT